MNYLGITFLLLLGLVQQPKPFEGVIIFEISYEVHNSKKNASLPPSEQRIYIKGSKSRFVQTNEQSKTIIILDSKEHHATVLMEMMDQKWKFELMQDELSLLKLTKEKEVVTTETGKTKNIGGYICHELEVTYKDSLTHAIVYYTPKIPVRRLRGMDGLHLKGFPLEYTIFSDDVNMKIVADTIYQEHLSDSLFIIPKGYKTMPEEAVASLKNKF